MIEGIAESEASLVVLYAVCTPDFFGFNVDGTLQYRGRLDDARMGDPTNRKPELLAAMTLVAVYWRWPNGAAP